MSDLNTAQQNAVQTTEGPLMILAGAGSGKTKTLVSRMTYLLREKKISPFRLLTLTFSNKAAREMRERVARDISLDIGPLQVTTFHSFCNRVLRSEINYLGLSQNFTIYDEGESRSLIKKILAQKGLTPKDQSPYEILYYINDLKNQGFYPGAGSSSTDSDTATDQTSLCYSYDFDREDPHYDYYQQYEAELHLANAVDFGGLITGVLQLFNEYPDILERYQKRFDYIMVDEYQDTNRAQFQLLAFLSQTKKNICVVGDEDQSIYSWRGADIRNILDFEKFFNEARLIKLEENYRSSKTIIEAASHVISKNVARKGKTMWTKNDEGDSIEIIECIDDKKEGEFVSREILNLANAGEKWRDIAIFYRNNSQSRIIEDHLRKEGIPYRVVAGIKFYERKEVKDMLAYMRIVINPKDSLALSRIINTPTRGIGVTTLRKLEELAIQNQISLWEAIQDIVLHPERDRSLRLSSKILSSLGEFYHLIDKCMKMDKQKGLPSEIYDTLLHESGFYESLKASKSYESLMRIENLNELENAIKQFEEDQESPTLSHYLETITLDNANDEKLSPDGDVSLMTIHGSKGLEFNSVFVTGVEENIFPSKRSIEDGELGLEEERRLFYVAMTRAMEKLYISFAQGRMLFGHIKFNGPSRFIDEIPNKYYSWNTYVTEKTKQDRLGNGDIDYGDEYSQIPVFKEKYKKPKKKKKIHSTFSDGSKVCHSLYGEGRVLESQGMGNDEKVIIQFLNGSRKKFLVKFAPIMPI
ncbi:MAG: UvrD-helicase domain-containing protein [Bacteriovoracales bacterium]|nr:UvrD-helicase domain-containing protein [Bacteriovoracales bacterium]